MNASGIDDAYGEIPKKTNWIVSNPPYKRGLLDEIINFQIGRIAKQEVYGVAMLLRAQFDFAKKREEMFYGYYAGQTKLCFRPIWIEPEPNKKKVEPIHNYCWHVWKVEGSFSNHPVVKYWYEKNDNK